MTLEVVFGESSGTPAAQALHHALRDLGVDGTLYLGYPVLSTADAKVFVDALLVSPSRGLVAFDLTSQVAGRDAQIAIAEKQDQLYASLYNKLNNFRQLRKGRSLAVTINVVTFHVGAGDLIQEENLVISPPDRVGEVLQTFEPFSEDLYKPLNAAIQRVTTLRPQKKRERVVRSDSRGAILKKIEAEIANLDTWQNRGAIEYANGPQRVRGLAGSGKTVVLALKAAYLHVRHPEWKIAVTFNSRALYQQFRDLIRRFTFDQIEDDPDWSQLQVLHGWGSSSSSGVYSTVCAAYGISPLDWRTANGKYGNRAFEGACSEVNAVISKAGPKHLFDAVLIDEAQDFPESFFRMVYNVVSSPHRIVWAYDDLQNLGDYIMPSEQQLFGADKHGNALVTLRNEADKPREDIVLPVCYRNTPWALATAHALGFGLYRAEGIVQMFEEPSIWLRIGYEVERGRLELGQHVTVARRPDSYPSYFLELLSPDDAIQTQVFDTESAQYQELAKAIKYNLEHDELEHTDILIVLPDTWTSRSVGGKIMQELLSVGIKSHLAGVTSSRDEVFVDGSIAITHIHRAKGNEAPVVYVVNSEHCQSGFELSRKRNILFTAITRSRCWIRLFGVGERMKLLEREVNSVRSHNYQLDFDYPTSEQIAKLARVHRDMTDEEKREWEQKLSVLGDIARAVRDGELPIEGLPAEFREIAALLGKKSSQRLQ